MSLNQNMFEVVEDTFSDFVDAVKDVYNDVVNSDDDSDDQERVRRASTDVARRRSNRQP